jgi:AraC-like DNA-binding protein
MSKILGFFTGRFGKVVLFDANEPVHEHAHSQLHVLIKIEGADSSFDVGGEKVLLTNDQMVLLNPWSPHANPRDSDAESTILLALYLEPVWLGMIGQNMSTESANTLFSENFGQMSYEVKQSSFEVARLVQDSIGQEENLEELLFNLMREIVEHFCNQSLQRQLPHPSRQIDYRIRAAVKYMRDHTSKEVKLDSLAKHVSLSRSRFYEQFRACVGVSPRVYLDALCIEEAIRLLSSKNRTLADISETLGFSAQAHFTRFFRSKMGVPPSDIRRVIYDLMESRMILQLEDNLA